MPQKTPPARDRSPDGKFAKGFTANPGGVPRWVKDVRALAGKHSPEALRKLLDLVRKGKDEVAVRAAEAILDRAGLKPFCHEPEKLDVTNHETGDAIGRLSALVARRLAARRAAGDPGATEPSAS